MPPWLGLGVAVKFGRPLNATVRRSVSVTTENQEKVNTR